MSETEAEALAWSNDGDLEPADETEALAAQEDYEPKVVKRKVGGVLTYTCSRCDKSFKHHGTAARHLLTHGDVRNFACPLCPLRFRRQLHLDQHSRTHTGERPFQCPHCPSTFKCDTTYRGHLRVHDDARDYLCVICGQSFQRRAHLTRHSRKHGYPICVCGREFVSLEKLEAHQSHCSGPLSNPHEEEQIALTSLAPTRRIANRIITRVTQPPLSLAPDSD
jgi:uncharacterized Zn-finger protein